MSDMMQQMFKVQIGMLAHCVVNGYREAMKLDRMPDFDALGVVEQDEIVRNVEFWLANPDAPIEASHEAWMASQVATGWHLGETLDIDNKVSPYIRTFDELPAQMQVMEYLFRSAVTAVTYTQDKLPAYRDQIALINYAIMQRFPEESDPEKRGMAWNALPEDERLGILDKLREERDRVREKFEKRRQWIEGVMKVHGYTPTDWEALTEDERLAKLDDYGAVHGLGSFLTDEERAQMATQQVAPAAEEKQP